MKERPILFNGEMVRAILSGRKTQTRRIMKDQPEVIPPEDECGVPGYWIPCHAGKTMVRNDMMKIACPLGMRGDQLWVRETWARYNIDQDSHDMAYRATKPDDWPEGGRWRPSIHMPRWASRINLLITGVRVERLNDISQEDAKSEGCCYGRGGGVPDLAVSPADHFPTLWESIYGIKSWAANPWVWVIEFERVAPAGEQS
ncbi:morphogenetic protein [Rahnella inusitata]|uniref:morphogenetic protein n=1 Tax=Rahnella inusitata TaxID=58169 RepID=UPI0039BE7D5C